MNGSCGYLDSGGNIGSWATNEITQNQVGPLLAAMEAELVATGGQSQSAQIGVMSALQHVLKLRLPSAFAALKDSKPGKAVRAEAGALMDLYQSEDDVFRLAAWLKAKEDGKTDMEAGKIARGSFMDYHINAPWVQGARNTALPFIAFPYRAVPMLLEMAGKKPHKIMNLMLLAGGLNALGVLLAGGGDEERKLLPEEKAGRIWGLVSERKDPLSGETLGDRPSRILQPGMVLTIEPGLYVRPASGVPTQFHNIGIRIEDDAIVTANGCELISRGVPVGVNEIEALMRGVNPEQLPVSAGHEPTVLV